MSSNAAFFKHMGINELNPMNTIDSKQVKRYLHLGGQNYKNLSEKVPILDEKGKPLRFKVGGKTVFEVFKPLFKGGYQPVKGTENIFVRSKSRQNRTNKKGKQSGGIGAVGILSWIGIVLFAVLQLSSSFGSSSSSSSSSAPAAAQSQ
jgi:hypothetical protein